jgi:hypothetical protein
MAFATGGEQPLRTRFGAWALCSEPTRAEGRHHLVAPWQRSACDDLCPIAQALICCQTAMPSSGRIGACTCARADASSIGAMLLADRGSGTTRVPAGPAGLSQRSNQMRRPGSLRCTATSTRARPGRMSRSNGNTPFRDIDRSCERRAAGNGRDRIDPRPGRVGAGLRSGAAHRPRCLRAIVGAAAPEGRNMAPRSTASTAARSLQS